MKNSQINTVGKWLALMLVLVLIGLTACTNKESKNTSQSNATAPSITIHEAVFMGNIDETKLHIAAGTDLNQKDTYGSSPLTIASLFGKPEIARLLIKAGADLNIKSGDGSTPLHTSSFFCRTEIVKALLENGADITIRNNYGSTALEGLTSPFSDVKVIYDQLSRDLGPLGLKLDYKHIEKTRPIVAGMIKAHNH